MNNKGFTLLEVLASILILGILLASFFQIFIFSQKATTSNKEKLEAINIAETVLEQIKNGGCVKNIESDSSDECKIKVTGVGEKDGTITYHDQEFDVTINVIDAEDVDEEKFKDLELYSVAVTVEGDRASSALEGLVEKCRLNLKAEGCV